MVDAPKFLKDGQEVSVLINGETDLPMGVELPDKIVLLVSLFFYPYREYCFTTVPGKFNSAVIINTL